MLLLLLTGFKDARDSSGHCSALSIKDGQRIQGMSSRLTCCAAAALYSCSAAGGAAVAANAAPVVQDHCRASGREVKGGQGRSIGLKTH